MASSEDFWNSIEQIYGAVPHLIKLILQVNGFTSFLALKGIRYEDKQEFFQSLELTVIEIISGENDSPEKSEIEAELSAQHYSFKNFKLKPGHRNYIMNLMLEIEKIDVNDFFGRNDEEVNSSEIYQLEQTEEVKNPPPAKHQYSVAHLTPPNTSTRLIVRRSNNDKQVIVGQVEHGYSQHDQEEPEYIFEEEYLTDDTMDSIIKVEFDPIETQNESKKRKSTSNSSPSFAKRRPEQMYNEEFMAKCVNPRRRRVTLNKNYPPTDEGTRERFTDLIQQVSFSFFFDGISSNLSCFSEHGMYITPRKVDGN